MNPAATAGLAALECYQDLGRRADLDRTIDCLTEATTADPADAQAPVWRWWLAEAYWERGSLDEAVADWDRAVYVTDLLVASLDPGEPMHDPAVAMLAERLWRRAGVTGFAGIAALAERLDRLGAAAVRPVARNVVASYQGQALFEAYEQFGHRADLDRAIELMTGALTMFSGEPPDGDPVWEWTTDDGPVMLAVTLAHACQTRAESRADLDRSIGVSRWAIDRHGADPAARAMLTEMLANGYDLRWQWRAENDDDGAGEDLDAAIAAWIEVGDDPGTLVFVAALKAARADLRDDAEEARQAATMLAEAAGRAAVEDRPALLIGAAASARVSWEITGDLDALENAAAWADRAIAAAVDDDELLDAHGERIICEHYLHDNGRTRPGRGRRVTLLAEVSDDAVRALDRAVRADPEHRRAYALLAGYLLIAAAGAEPDRLDGALIRGLLAMAAASPSIPPHFVEFGLANLDLLETGDRAENQPDEAMRRLAAALASAGSDAEMRERVLGVLELAANVRGGVTGDRRLLDAGQALARRSRGWAPPPAGRRVRGDSVSVESPLFSLMSDVMELARQGRPEAARQAIAAAADLLAAHDSGLDRHMVTFLRTIQAALDPLSGPALDLLAEDAGPALLGFGHLQAAFTAAMAALRHLSRGERPEAIAAVEHLEGLADRVPPRNRQARRLAYQSAGTLRLTLARGATTGGAADADRAVRDLRTAMELSGGPSASGWAHNAMACARALRLTTVPDLGGSRALGLSALRAHAWQVFAQAGTDHAMAIAATVAADAADLVDWCLADRARDPGVLDQLIAVLEGSRALVLRASGAGRRVPELLRDRHRDDLAAEWEATTGRGRDLLTGSALADEPAAALEVPDALRLEVVAALGDRAVTGLEPVPVAAIQGSLRALGRHALIYLVPRAAVVVPVAGEPYVVDLPALTDPPIAGAGRPGGEARDLGPAGDDGPTGDGLDTLCAWAWRVAMGPLIAARPGRHVVLVPTGDLAAVPWHAAYQVAGDERHYAVRDLVVSYSPSARLLDGPPAGGGTGPALVVGDPSGDLPAAGDEARAVHQVFYPHGTYLGAGADRPGSAADVLAWLTGRPGGAALLHFAGHAVGDPARPADAHLVLAGGTLGVRRLLDSARSAALDVDRVFLAACTTGSPGGQHDEALSLAASFLVAGARTVFGSLWPVPDGDTALLMFMVHHYLRREACEPAEALHRAQLWMLDPRRALPSGTPSWLLRHHRAGSVPELSAWAGFIHLGR